MEEEVVECLGGPDPPRRGSDWSGGHNASSGTSRRTFRMSRRYRARARPLLNRLGYRSFSAVPLFAGEQIMGGLTVWRRKAGEFRLK